ncbi:MAG: efflux RND transporter periplasmic adaptor subunit [Sneathiella sp.]|nr:efflux RND transporter periplasmic adaptor subunit [Sneathiella sp.]
MNRSVIIATIIAVGATGWIVSGQFGQSEAVTTDVAMQTSDPIVSEIAAALQPKRTDPTQVHVQIYTAEPRAQQVIVRGTTEAIRTVTIKAETPGRVVATYVEIGQRVKKGDTLVKFAIKDRNAQLKEAEALVRQRQIEYKAAKSLSKKGFSAKTTLAGTKALLDSALAKAQSVRILLSDLVIKAPFDGIVEERQAEIGDFIKDGNSVITIVDESPFLVVGQISEIYVNKIKIGDKGTAKLVTGESIEGVIRFIGKKSDPATRTFRVELLVQNEGNSLRAGVTSETTYSTEEVMATFISPAILTLNDTGILGVRSVDDSDIVHFHPVNVLTDSSKGAWITGLPPQVRLIKVGQEFVRAGEKVNPQSKTAGVQ